MLVGVHRVYREDRGEELFRHERTGRVAHAQHRGRDEANVLLELASSSHNDLGDAVHGIVVELADRVVVALVDNAADLVLVHEATP